MQSFRKTVAALAAIALLVSCSGSSSLADQSVSDISGQWTGLLESTQTARVRFLEWVLTQDGTSLEGDVATIPLARLFRFPVTGTTQLGNVRLDGGRFTMSGMIEADPRKIVGIYAFDSDQGQMSGDSGTFEVRPLVVR